MWGLRCLFDYARKDHRDPLHTYPLEGIKASVARGLRVLRFEWFFLFCFARQGYDCGVVFFTSPFHLGGRHAKPFTRNLEGECARGGMNFVSVLPTISHELSYLSYE